MFSTFQFETKLTFSTVSCSTLFVLYFIIIDIEYNGLCKLGNLYAEAVVKGDASAVNRYRRESSLRGFSRRGDAGTSGGGDVAEAQAGIFPVGEEEAEADYANGLSVELKFLVLVIRWNVYSIRDL